MTRIHSSGLSDRNSNTMHSTDTMANNSLSALLVASEYDSDQLSRLTPSVESPFALYTAVGLMIVIIIVGCIGNIMVILAVRNHKKLQTASNAFVVNLSVCDLAFVTVILPFNIYTYLVDDWNLSPSLCKLIGFLGYTLTGTTIITITMIAYNRYKLVVDLQNYQRTFCRRNMALMLTVSWVLPVLCLMPAVLEKWGRFGYVTMMVTCNLLLDHDSQSFKLFLLCVRAIVPCILILYYYISIYRTTKASHRRVLSKRLLTLNPSHMDQMIQRKEMHLTKMMATIFIVFALSYFPCSISSIVDWNTVLSKRFHMFCLITVYVGSAVNPLIYGLMNSQFRNAYYSIMLCHCFSTSDLLPSPSPSTFRRKLPQSKRKKARCSQLTMKLPGNLLSPSPLASIQNHMDVHGSAETSDEQNYSGRAKTHPCKDLSMDSDGSTPLSSQDMDSHSDHCLHRSETERTCLGDSC